ncbi:MAG: hypothetical protein U1E52_18680 [Geminicoccaceae bacterium]
MFFEGQEDVGLLRKFSADRGIEPLEVFGYGVAGSGNVKHFLRMTNELGIVSCAIFDKDKENDFDEARRLFPDCLVELLPMPDIRDKIRRDKVKGEDILEKEGLFDNTGNIKVQHEQYLLDLIERIRTYFVDKAATGKACAP